MMTACGSPKRDTTTASDTTTSLDPTFTTSTTSPTGTATENLFTTQSGSTTQTDPAAGSSSLSSVTASEAGCLSSNGGFGLSSYGVSQTTATATSSSNLPCLNSGTFGANPSLLYDAAYTSYQTADYCLQQAAQYAPRAGQSQMDIQINMQYAELGLIKCMRDLVNYQYQGSNIPWGNSQVSAFQHADHNLWSIGNGLYR